MDEGIIPTLAELITLRVQISGRRLARCGSVGVQGHAQSNLRGRGMEYAESREYAMGDDARHIDWRLTARSGKPHTKLYQAERERLTLLVADTAPALYFGTRVRFKSVQAARVGALAAWLAAADGDRIAALRGTSKEAPIAPASGSRGALRVLDALVRWYAHAPTDDLGLVHALKQAQRLLRPGSRLLVLADPASLPAVPDALWPALAQHHELLVVLLTDPLECRPPIARLPFRTRDAERIALDLDSAAVRQRWKHVFADPIEQAVTKLQAQGARVMRVSTADASDGWLSLAQRASARPR